MATLINADAGDKRDFDQTVTFNTAAAPPPQSVLSGMRDAGFEVTHLYGLTETYGPAVVNEWKVLGLVGLSSQSQYVRGRSSSSIPAAVARWALPFAPGVTVTCPSRARQVGKNISSEAPTYLDPAQT